MNKYIEKIYDEDTKLHIHLSEDIENAPQKSLEVIFDETEENDAINTVKDKCFECFYTDIYVHIPIGVTCIKKYTFYYAFKQISEAYHTAWREKKIDIFKYNKFKIYYDFPDGLKKIEDDAFYLTGAYILNRIPESVEYIGKNSFRFENQKTLILPKNISYISERAFSFSYECELIIKDNPRYFTDGYALYDKQEKMLLFYFGDAKDCESFEIWNETEKISSNAFFYGNLKEVILPESIKKIQDETFAHINIKRIILKSFDTEVSDFAVRYPVKVIYPDNTTKTTKGFKSHYHDYMDYKSNNYKPVLENKAEEISVAEEDNQHIIENTSAPQRETFIQPELNIDEISKEVENHKKEFDLKNSKNPFDFDTDEIFNETGYDYNTLDDIDSTEKSE